jgi:hypothetical protein
LERKPPPNDPADSTPPAALRHADDIGFVGFQTDLSLVGSLRELQAGACAPDVAEALSTLNRAAGMLQQNLQVRPAPDCSEGAERAMLPSAQPWVLWGRVRGGVGRVEGKL